MASTRVDCATEGCEGHFRVEGRNRRDADYRARKMVERGWTCRDCDNREAAVRPDEAGLPALEGTEKQVAWAVTLRESAIARIGPTISGAATIPNPERVIGFHSEAVDVAILMQAVGRPTLDEAFAAMKAETDARIWIDGRHETPAERLGAVVKRLAAEVRAMSPEGKAEAAAEQEAVEEATLRPAEPVSETIAEVSYRDGRLLARYDERSDAFNATVKGLGYRWDPAVPAWTRRHLPATMGAPVDRLAETAHELLAAGIVVAMHDPEARAKAVERSYEPEHRRWISLATSGAHEGKLIVSWGRDEDLYQAFRSLPAATYKDRTCLVPTTSRDELLDFAEAHGFRFTARAQASLDEVMARRERGVVVDAKARPKAEVARTKARGERPDSLAIPSDVALDDDLVDHD